MGLHTLVEESWFQLGDQIGSCEGHIGWAWELRICIAAKYTFVILLCVWRQYCFLGYGSTSWFLLNVSYLHWCTCSLGRLWSIGNVSIACAIDVYMHPGFDFATFFDVFFIEGILHLWRRNDAGEKTLTTVSSSVKSPRHLIAIKIDCERTTHRHRKGREATITCSRINHVTSYLRTFNANMELGRAAIVTCPVLRIQLEVFSCRSGSEKRFERQRFMWECAIDPFAQWLQSPMAEMRTKVRLVSIVSRCFTFIGTTKSLCHRKKISFNSCLLTSFLALDETRQRSHPAK